MRKLLLLVVALALAGGIAATALAATRSVKVGDNYFIRKGTKPTITVARGTTVVWRFRGQALHNVTVKRGPVRFHSALKSSGTYSHRLTRAGTYRIVCTIHQPDMAMTIRVQ
jgi:plastocyanin